MRRRDVLAFAGIVAGAAGVVALGFFLKKFIANKKVERFEEELVARIVEGSPFKEAVRPRKRLRKAKNLLKKQANSRKTTAKSAVQRTSSLVFEKTNRARKLLSAMDKGQAYTQVMLEKQSHLPYRSVRRYVEYLVQQGKVQAMGYGKGKKFMRV